MRLSQEMSRKSPKRKRLKVAVRVTNLAPRYEIFCCIVAFCFLEPGRSLNDSILTYNILKHSPHASQNQTQRPRRCNLQRMKKRVRGRTNRKILTLQYVVHAIKVTDKIYSGSAVTFARTGSTACASRSLQPKRSTSSNTSAPLVALAAREPRFRSNLMM